MVFRNEMHDVASPLDEVRMFQALYFPQLAGEEWWFSRRSYLFLSSFTNNIY